KAGCHHSEEGARSSLASSSAGGAGAGAGACRRGCRFRRRLHHCRPGDGRAELSPPVSAAGLRWRLQRPCGCVWEIGEDAVDAEGMELAIFQRRIAVVRLGEKYRLAPKRPDVDEES